MKLTMSIARMLVRRAVNEAGLEDVPASLQLYLEGKESAAKKATQADIERFQKDRFVRPEFEGDPPLRMVALAYWFGPGFGDDRSEYLDVIARAREAIFRLINRVGFTSQSPAFEAARTAIGFLAEVRVREQEYSSCPQKDAMVATIANRLKAEYGLSGCRFWNLW
jgi:hypothetical protein